MAKHAWTKLKDALRGGKRRENGLKISNVQAPSGYQARRGKEKKGCQQ